MQLEKEDGSFYTFDPFNSIYPFYPQAMQIRPPYKSDGGNFEMKFWVDDPTVYANLKIGGEILFSLGKSDATKKKIMLGIMNDIETIWEHQEEAYIQVSGPDWGSNILQHRLVKRFWKQRIDNEGNPDPDDDSTKIATIVEQLLTEPESYPTYSAGISADRVPTVEAMGVVVDPANIVVGTKTVPTFEAAFEFIGDKMRQLAELTNTIAYIDAEKKFHMRPESTIASGLLFVDNYNDATGLGWNPAKVALISDITSVTYRRTLEDHKRRLFGLGAVRRVLEQEQVNVGGGFDTVTQYLAMKINITEIKPDLLGLYLSKVGTPPLDLTVELVEDKNNQPNGAVVRTVILARDAVTPGGTIHYFDIAGGDLNSAKDYWIVLRPAGSDTGNCYRWHKNSASDTTRATSADGATWTVTGSSYSYAYQYYFSDELLSVLQDDSLSNDDHNDYHEEVIKQPDIRDKFDMTDYLAKLAESVFFVKEILRCAVYAPETLLESGQQIRARVTSHPIYNFDHDDFKLSEIDYKFSSDPDQQIGLTQLQVAATRLGLPHV